MSATPAIPLFGDAYMADTTHLSLEEDGAYLRLIMIAWRLPDCALPDDDTRLARMLKVTPAKWAKLKPVVMAFWTLSNKGWVHTARSTQAAARPSIPPSMRLAVYERDGGVCVYCGSDAGPFVLDHILPWSRGGLTNLDNLCLACAPCNNAKSDLTPEEWGL